MQATAGKTNLRVDLSGKTALITGAGSGIGYGVAKILADSGAHVLVNDISSERAQEAARQLNGKALPGDITHTDFINQVKEMPVDILVNNAGFQYVAPLEDFPPEVFRSLLEIMLVSPFLLSQTVVPGMRKKGFGRIINIASVHAKIASNYKAGYVSAKHGLLGLTRVIALETASFGVTANAICPGYVDTPLVRNQLKDLAVSHNLPAEQVLENIILRPVPQKRLLSPEEIGYLTIFLCSDAASSITAQGYTIDGGWSQI